MKTIIFELFNKMEAYEFPDSFTNDDIDTYFKFWVEKQTNNAYWKEASQLEGTKTIYGAYSYKEI